jgi:proteasome lid subunit RPN8/RPN11
MTDDRRSPPVGLRSTGTEPAATGLDRSVPAIAAWQQAAAAGHQRREEATAGETTARVPGQLLDAVVAWCLEGRPNEACGLLAGPGLAAAGVPPTRFLPLTNAAASPYRYLIDPQEQLRAVLAIDDADEEVWGIVHSHVASPAVPSDTDVGLAGWPDALYLICSLAVDPPEVRAWSIRDGVVAEVTLVVT